MNENERERMENGMPHEAVEDLEMDEKTMPEDKPSKLKVLWARIQLITIIVAIAAYFGRGYLDKREEKQTKEQIYNVAAYKVR